MRLGNIGLVAAMMGFTALACTSFGGTSSDTPPAEAPVDAGSENPVLTGQAPGTVQVQTDKWSLVHGTAQTVKVSVTRGAGVGGPVTITVDGLPGASTVAPLKIPDSATTGDLVVTLDASTPAGDLSGVVLKASSVDGTLVASSPVAVTVLPAPGDLDPAFGTGGVMFLANPGPFDVAGDDRIYVAEGPTDLNRFTPDGAIDTTFGTGGKISFGQIGYLASSLVVGSSSLVIGRTTDGGSFASYVTASRHALDGTPDPTFSGYSKRSAGTANAFAINPAGRIVAVGRQAPSGGFKVWWISAGGVDDTAVNADASSMDTSPVALSDAVYLFDGAVAVGGSYVMKLGTAGGSYAWIRPLAASISLRSIASLAQGGEFLVSGIDTSTNRLYLARIAVAGQVDPTFVSDPPVTTMTSAETTMFVSKSGTILQAGQVSVAGKNRCAVARFQSGGQLDKTFGQAGVVVLPIDDCTPKKIRMQSNGNALLLGGGFIARFLM